MIQFTKDSGLTIDELCTAMQYEIIRDCSKKEVAGCIVMVTREHMFYLRSISTGQYERPYERCNVSSNVRFREVNLMATRL